MNISEEEQAKLFEIKSRFFREIPHPKLILKAIRDLGFEITTVQPQENFIFKYENFSLVKVLEHYIHDILAIKLHISNAQSTIQLAQLLSSLNFTLINFLSKIAEYATNAELDKLMDMKVSVSFDAHEMLKFIELKGLEESQIKTYICERVNSVPLSELDALCTACLRAKKIIENG